MPAKKNPEIWKSRVRRRFRESRVRRRFRHRARSGSDEREVLRGTRNSLRSPRRPRRHQLQLQQASNEGRAGEQGSIPGNRQVVDRASSDYVWSPSRITYSRSRTVLILFFWVRTISFFFRELYLPKFREFFPMIFTIKEMIFTKKNREIWESRMRRPWNLE